MAIQILKASFFRSIYKDQPVMCKLLFVSILPMLGMLGVYALTGEAFNYIIIEIWPIATAAWLCMMGATIANVVFATKAFGQHPRGRFLIVPILAFIVGLIQLASYAWQNI